MAGSYDWQASFAAGVLGPSLHGRVDLAKYAVGLSEGENIFIHAHGGFSNRAGTELVAYYPTAGDFKLRLVPFERDDETAYVLGFSGGRLRFYQDGAAIMSGGDEYIVNTTYTTAQIPSMSYVQSVDVMYLAQIDHAPAKLMHYGPTNWAIESVATLPDVATPDMPVITSPDSGDGKVYKYVVSAVIDGVEGMPSPAGEIIDARDLMKEGSYNVVTWTAVSPAPDEYRVYRERGGIYGYIGFTPGATLTMTDDNINADVNTTPRQAQTYFNGPNEYPSVVTLSQQRLIWGATRRQPDLIIGSVVGDYENYSKAFVTKPDDRFRIEISGEKLNKVAAMVGMQELVVFTGSGEYGVGSNDGYLSATEPRQYRYGASGSNGVRPLLVGESVLYVDRSGQMIRDLLYSLERDGYSGADLSLFIPHYLSGRKVIDWAYTHTPFGLVWLVLDNGHVLSLTYKREQEVWAWTEHDFGGVVESVCSIWEDGEDRLYLSVRRGEDLCVERMASRVIRDDVHDSLFLDCAIRYRGPATKTITGLDHLNGKIVSALADGDVLHDLTVSGGQITLPYAAGKVDVGLRMKARGRTLPLYLELQGTGASRGLPMKTTEAFAQVEKTRGIVLRDGKSGTASHMVQTGAGDLSQAIPLFTGLWKFEMASDWSQDGTIVIEQDEPLPMTILGVSPKWGVGRG